MSNSLRLIPLILSASFASLSAQVTTPTTPIVRKGTSPQKETTQPTRATMSERARQFNELLHTEDEAHTAWSRSVLRLIDRKDRANAALFSPEVTTEKRDNLFALLFGLLSEGKITAHSYQDSQVAWDESPQLTFADLIERFSIPASKDQRGKLHVAPADIPSALVEGYYIQEKSSFDERTSSFSTRPLALCPILNGVGDYGQVRMPLFWVSYEELRPYLAEKKSALSAMNTAQRASLDDFFTLGLYRGEIIQSEGFGEQAPSGRPLDPAESQARTKRLQAELQQFERSLYLPDSILHPAKPAKSSKKKSVSSPSSTSSSPATRGRDRRIRPSKPTRTTTPSTATRSVRDRA